MCSRKQFFSVPGSDALTFLDVLVLFLVSESETEGDNEREMGAYTS